MMVYEDFHKYYRSGVYEYILGASLGSHATLIVGYDDSKQCFIGKNSWGTDWGEDIYFEIAYSQINNKVRFGEETIAYSPDKLGSCEFDIWPQKKGPPNFRQ
jgi:C1A family cysteine protease